MDVLAKSNRRTALKVLFNFFGAQLDPLPGEWFQPRGVAGLAVLGAGWTDPSQSIGRLTSPTFGQFDRLPFHHNLLRDGSHGDCQSPGGRASIGPSVSLMYVLCVRATVAEVPTFSFRSNLDLENLYSLILVIRALKLSSPPPPTVVQIIAPEPPGFQPRSQIVLS